MVWPMVKVQSRSAARAAARRAQEKASEERVRQERLNVEDLATFMVAVDRLGAVDEWAAERIALVEAEADRRRQEQREVAGAALQALRGRGEAIATIVELAGVPEGQVRAYLRLAAHLPGERPDSSGRGAEDGAAASLGATKNGEGVGGPS